MSYERSALSIIMLPKRVSGLAITFLHPPLVEDLRAR